jgi:hypothetical protein
MKIIKDGHLNIDLTILFDAMSVEEKRELILSLSMQEDLRDEVVAQLAGENPDYWYGNDDERIVKILTAMEKRLLSQYRYSYLYKIDQFVKNHASNKEIYWKMWHDERYGEFFQRWFGENNITSNYKTECKELDELREFLSKTFKALKNGLDARLKEQTDGRPETN